ncbi:MAG: DUF6152 family protein [Woeseiaceae bacterium]
MKFRSRMSIGVLAVLAAGPTNAHHAATATFDTSQSTEIEGYVTEFRFANPHVTIKLMVTDESGEERAWIATAPAVAGFRRWGWTKEMLQEGQYVRLVGRKARHDGPMILIERADIESGSLLELNPDDGSFVRVLEGPKPNQTPDDLVVPPLKLADGRPNLAGTWLAAAPGSGPPRTNPTLNATGQALQDQYDPKLDPAFTACAKPGLVRSLTGIQSVRITQNDDYVLIEQEGDASRRLVYLDGRAAKATDKSRIGHSVARYDGNALIIETSQLLGNLSSGRGHELSDQTTTVERYERADDENHAALQLTLRISDPGHLTDTWEANWRKLQTHDYAFAETNCQLPVFSSAN